MIRIGVLGDTHGNYEMAELAFRDVGKIDLILHTGDYYQDAQRIGRILGIKVEGVTGNCDFWSRGPKEKVLELGGKRIYLTHGHQYGVKKGYLNLYYRGKEMNADLIIFGHTHVASKEDMDDLILFNPGSFTYPRTGLPTYGLVLIDQGNIEVKTFQVTWNE
ncbi:MAG: metallophosphoesterase [Syntrophomonadaceae bacterium]|nr:metallophosphoesterase [Syntrophomonadaceae bacterium]